MNSFTFIYIIGIFFILNLFQGFQNIELENQLIYSSLFILLIGIPHGAIDHILLFRKREMSQITFYGIYLGLIIGFVVLWHITPVISLLFFLLISAFHFGESQFSDISFNKILRYTFYFFWGLCLLSSLMFYNVDELYEITSFFDDTIILEKVYNKETISIFFYLTNLITIGSILTLLLRKKLILIDFFQSLFLLFLIHITFLLISFYYWIYTLFCCLYILLK
jgi:Brp/Blh family beta-carotene 15,15'-monooxygenase